MKRFTLLISVLITQLFFINVYAQINTGNPAVPFGSNTSYDYGIMPTNLPTTGEYGRSQHAADAYNYWKNQFVERCSNGSYRVKFDNPQQTVSEGIAYGMLLSVYAADKVLFDGFWQFYKNSMNGNGVMHWMTDGCNGNARDNGATDAELDAAHALIIASEQWSDDLYLSEARTLLNSIKTYEIHPSSFQTLNGDAWGSGNTCRNPSYQSPAYYRQYALVHSGNESFWGNVTSASEELLDANKNNNTGLVGNWCDPNGVSNACAGTTPNEYGSDACRTPWRMATDVLWHGPQTASTAFGISQLLSNWLAGYEGNLKGPMAQNAPNPSAGTYKIGTYTTFALAPMAMGSNYQNSLNACYTNVAGLGNDGIYFNETIKTLTLFVLTGNFWKPGSSGMVRPPEFLRAATNELGNEIIVTLTKPISSPASNQASSFTLLTNGTPRTGSITGISLLNSTTIVLSVEEGIIQPGQTLALSYSPGNIQGTDGATMESFSSQNILNLIAGNETIFDDCEDGEELNNVGGIWYTFNDKPDHDRAATPGTISTIAPLTDEENPFRMSSPGYESDYAVNASYTLGTPYTPYNEGSPASWTNPAYVGIGTWVDKDENNTMDWRNGVGVSFWYKGPASTFQVIIEEVTDFCFHKYDVPASADWTQIVVEWNDLIQPTWGTQLPFSAQNVQKLQWQFESGVSEDGEFWIDDVRIMGMPPVNMTEMAIIISSESDITDELNLTIESEDTLKLDILTTPGDASYPVVFWSSSNENVVTVDYLGRVFVEGYGEATITARSKMHQEITADFLVRVPAPAVEATDIVFDPDEITIAEGEIVSLTPIFIPEGEVTQTGITWESSDPSIVYVNNSGMIEGMATGGPVTITATSTTATGVFGTVSVTVVAMGVDEVLVDYNDTTITLGSVIQLAASVLPENASNQTLIWESDDETIVTVNGLGAINAVGVGSTFITITSEDNSAASQIVNIEVLPVSIDSVLLSTNELNLDLGEENVQITSTVYPALASQLVEWTTSDPSVASVVGGFITTVGAGETTIRATSSSDETVYAECIVTVSAALAETITLNETVQTIYVGETFILEATVLPETASSIVEWSSDNEDVATVNAEGTVLAISEGTANITATATDGSNVSASCEITVENVLVTSITLNETSISLEPNATSILFVSQLLPANATIQTVTWSSEDDNIATVDQDGIITAIAEGTTNIIATANDGSGISASCEVVVETSNIPVEEVTIDLPTEVLYIGSTITLNATATPNNATNPSLVWSSLNEDIATVNQLGVVTGVAEGDVTIIATSTDGTGVSANMGLTVYPILPTSITIPETLNLLAGGATQTILATIEPENTTNQNIIWESSNDNIATVVDGVVTPLAIGEVTITASCEADITVNATCVVTVSEDEIIVESIALNESELNIAINTNATLIATITPDNATNTNVTWSSDNDQIATVNQQGRVSGVSVGTTTITVTTEDGGHTATCEVNVSLVEVTEIQLSQTTLSLTPSSPNQTLTATVIPDNASITALTWSSSEESVVTVTQNGVVSVEGEGEATITVTATDGSGIFATCEVSVSDATISVTGVEVTPETLDLTIRASSFITGTITPTNASNQAITWTSRNETIASITPSTGLVRGNAVGSTYIVATTQDGSFMDSCLVTVSGIPVVSIDVNPTSVETNTGVSFVNISAEVLPASATTRTLNWASENTDIVTVSQTGRISIEGPGETTVTVSSTDGSNISVVIPVTVEEVLVESVQISQSTASLTIGGTTRLSANVLPTNAYRSDITWSSSNSNIVRVENGFITGVAAGDATITATDESGNFSATCEVTVSAQSVLITSFSIQEELNIVEGNTETLTREILPANATNQTLSWESSNELIATVDETGSVSAISVGSVTITATTTDGSNLSSSCEVTVSEAVILVQFVSLPSAIEITVGDEAQITATVLPENANNRTLAWTSSNTSVATVDPATGFVTSLTEGTTTITATATDGSGRSNTCIVTVSPVATIPVTEIRLSHQRLLIEEGAEPIQITATVLPENATNTNLRWTLSNDNVSIENGLVTPNSAGTTNLTVSSVSQTGITAVCYIEVVTKVELRATISNALSLHNSSVEGTETGQYAEGSRALLLAAIETAQNSESSTIGQTSINAANQALLDAISEFQRQRIVDETLIFDAEMENMTYLATYWFSFNDNGVTSDGQGASTITPLSSEENPFTMTEGGFDSTGYAARMVYTLDGGTLPYDPYVGMGMPFDQENGFDASATTGITFSYKATHSFFLEVGLTSITDDANYNIVIPASEEWTTVVISWDQLSQYTWGTARAWDPSIITQVMWKVQRASGSGELWVDNVAVKGAIELPAINYHLTVAMAQAEALLSVAEEGTENGQYVIGSIAILEAAIEAAQAVVDNEDATQSQIDAQIAILNDAIATFNASIVGGVNMNELIMLVFRAEIYADMAVIGTNAGQYPEANYTNLVNAINAANLVLINSSASMIDVMTAGNNLSDAIDQFLESRIELDYEELEVRIVEVEQLLANPDGYSDQAIANLTSALNAAKSVLNNALSQQAVDDAATALNNAKRSFITNTNEIDVEEETVIVYPTVFADNITVKATTEIVSITVTSMNAGEVVSFIPNTKLANISLGHLASATYSLVVVLKDGTIFETTITKK